MQPYAFPRQVVVKACFLSDYRDCVYLRDMPSALLLLTLPRPSQRCIMGRRPDRERGVSAAWLSCAKRCCIIVVFRLSWGEGLFCYAVHYCTVCKLIMTQSGMDHAHVLSPDLFLYEESLKRVVSFNQSLFSFSFPFFFFFGGGVVFSPQNMHHETNIT